MRPTEKLRDMSDKYGVAIIAATVLDDKRFPVWSGSSKPGQHHYGKGGLAQHVLEVTELCLKNNEYFKTIGEGVDDQKLFLAAVFHDAGKMHDYIPQNSEYKEWTGCDHKRLVHHISRSALIWHKAQDVSGYSDSDDEVLHCILSHHGQRAWGSPVSPGTRMAWILHLSDMLSARVNDCLTWDRHG